MRKPDAKTFNTGGASPAAALRRKGDRKAGRSGLTFGEMAPKYSGEGGELPTTGTSVFDPVLCELAYRWFCPPGGVVVDPFAGGSVRGLVAAKLGRQYYGVDLRAEQIEANHEQAARITPDNMPTWVCGDSAQIIGLLAGVDADFVFSCPPYADLEVYSNDPRDLSTMDYEDFRAAYADIIERTCQLLKPDRFACFVVGDVRDKDGMYRGFPWHTIEAFQRAGLRLYNEAVLLTAIGSLPIRTGKQFQASRKLGKSHQNVLVFCKGDPVKAVAAIGDVEFGEGEPGTIDLGAALDAAGDADDLVSDPWAEDEGSNV
ncbi:DNA methylase [Rhodopseudomonas faecalis]|uniref:Methyltransferase n=1 Tax=Rhodopseudomonas faecalis TaxID=99655 RepID=A0A318TK55_9BRAD|nr:DNA methyltransferase [Rhodopseudomonas faecalis]PYF05024.1 DNA methylase [Rhodopseudomonas faecalis]